MDATAAAVAAVLLVLAVLLLVSRRAASYASGSRLPPGPMALPLIGHLHLISSPPHRALDRILARYGPLVYLRLGPSTHCVDAGTADAARDLLKFEASIPERPLTAVTRHLAYDDAGFAFAPYGPHWRFMKRLCMSELLGPRTVDQLRPVREAELAAVLGAARDAAGRGEAIDVSRQLISMSNNAIMRMVASALPGHMTEAARDCAKHVAEVVGAFNVEDYVALCRGWDLQGLMRRTREVRDKFDALLEIMITAKEEARAGRSPAPAAAPPTKDLLDILMDAAEDQNAEFKLTRENIDQGLRPRHLHRWFRHDRHQRGVDAVASHQPPGLHGQAARRAGRRRGRVAAGGRAGRRQAPLPAGRLQGDTPAAAAGRVRAAGDHRAGARPRLHHPAQDLHLLQHLLHRPRPWLVGGAPPVPTGALHARRRRRHRRPQGPAHAAHAVRERPPRLPRHGPRYAGRASVPRRAGAVLRLGGAHPSGSLKGAAAGHGRGGRPCRRPEAPAPAHPDPTLQSTARSRLASNATTTLPARQYLF